MDTEQKIKTKKWWKESVIYQIYPRSFMDTSGNGIGDIKGIEDKLSYIADLGVDAVWLSPVFSSPMKDMGYDIKDYKNIDTLFGSMKEFETLIAKCHKKNIKIIVDQVLSHSSDQLPFFQQSRANKSSSKADWYVWADPKPDGSPPNNWLSVFGGSAWEWEPLRSQYYLHNFLSSQPDFNFHNLEVQDWLLDTSRFWLEKGIDGFRLDTVNYYFHDKELKDNPPSPLNSEFLPDDPYYMQDQINSINQKENLIFLEKYRSLLEEYPDKACVGEIGDAHRALELMEEYTKGTKRLHMAYSFELLGNKFNPNHFRNTVEEFFQGTGDGWPCWSFSNHDVKRHVSRWGALSKDKKLFSKMTGALLMSLRGSVCLYQGEELGQTETELKFEELTDPLGLRYWPKNKGRDGCRTPMPWSKEKPNGGFSKMKPWLPLKEEQLNNSVSVQEINPSSVLNFYKDFIKFRKITTPLKSGSIEFYDIHKDLLFFSRQGDYNVACLFNFSDKRIQIQGQGYEAINNSPCSNFQINKLDVTLGETGFCFLKLQDNFVLEVI